MSSVCFYCSWLLTFFEPIPRPLVTTAHCAEPIIVPIFYITKGLTLREILLVKQESNSNYLSKPAHPTPKKWRLLSLRVWKLCNHSRQSSHVPRGWSLVSTLRSSESRLRKQKHFSKAMKFVVISKLRACWGRRNYGEYCTERERCAAQYFTSPLHS